MALKEHGTNTSNIQTFKFKSLQLLLTSVTHVNFYRHDGTRSIRDLPEHQWEEQAGIWNINFLLKTFSNDFS